MMVPRIPRLTFEQIRLWRDRLGISQYEAADLIGVSIRSYTMYEKGEAAISKSIALACFAIETICKQKGEPTYAELKECVDDILKEL